MTSTDRQKRRILVIDDDPEVQHLLLKILRKGGYEVIPAHNGAEGKRAYELFDPHLILLDLKMPGIDGTGFLRELHAQGGKPRVPVVILSAHLHKDPSSLLALGATTLLPKPFQARELLNLIQCLL